MKSRKTAPAASNPDERPRGRGVLPRPGETEATRPRSKRDEVQKGPGSASADVQMTADGGAGDDTRRRR